MYKQALIGFSGGPGSFSEVATIAFCKKKATVLGQHPTMLPLLTAPRVYQNLIDAQIDFGVVPVKNSLHGVVVETQQAQALHGHLIEEVDSCTMPIEQCLILYPGVALSAITQVVGHPQALGQSKMTREKLFPGIPTQDWQDTADAARALMEGEFDQYHTAVVASRRAAALYGMQVLQVVNDRVDNETTFLLVRKKKH